MAVKAIVVMFLSATLSFVSSLLPNTCDDDSYEVGPKRKMYNTGFGITIPGTKWCGPGDTAEHEEDLGEYQEEDKCCRAHDNCFEYMNGGQQKYGLKNKSPFTRLHCQCEHDFRLCLKKIDSSTANFIGSKYFSLRIFCYKFDYPIIECLEHETVLFSRRCVTYQVDTRQFKKWQWFHNPFW